MRKTHVLGIKYAFKMFEIIQKLPGKAVYSSSELSDLLRHVGEATMPLCIASFLAFISLDAQIMY